MKNIVAKGEIARFEQFLLFSLCFSKAVCCRVVRTRLYEGKGQYIYHITFANYPHHMCYVYADCLMYCHELTRPLIKNTACIIIIHFSNSHFTASSLHSVTWVCFDNTITKPGSCKLGDLIPKRRIYYL